MKALKVFGISLLAIAALFGSIFVLYLFFTVGVKFLFDVSPIVNWVAGALLFIDLVILVFALVPQFRYVVGTIILISSYLFGLSTWIYGLAATLSFWGIWGAVAGLFFAGIGFVPIGMLAAGINGEWGVFFTLFWTAAVTIVSRVAGLALVNSAENQDEITPNLDAQSAISTDNPTHLRKWKDIE